MGVANIALLTPVETQVLHLLLADTLWIVWIFFVGSGDHRRRNAAAAGDP